MDELRVASGVNKLFIVIKIKKPLEEIGSGEFFEIVYGGRRWLAQKTGAFRSQFPRLTRYDVRFLPSEIIKEIRGDKTVAIFSEFAISITWPGKNFSTAIGNYFCCSN